MYYHHPDTVYQKNAICLSCCSNKEEETSKNQQKKTLPQYRDKKISLKKQVLTNQRIEYALPIKESAIHYNVPQTTREVPNFSIPENPYKSTDFQMQQQHSTSAEKTHQSHFRHFQPLEQNYNSREKNITQSNGLRLTECTKLQRSNPNSNVGVKTRKSSHSERKGSVSWLNGRESVYSFFENHDLVEKLQESQVLHDFFNPSQSRLNEFKTIYKSSNPRKNSKQLARIFE